MTAVPSAPAGDVDRAPALELIVALLDRMHASGVSYCHWKSNEAIARSATGDNDLDLLVARADSSRFSAILHDLGFKVARPSAARRIPGILDYYGLDDPSGRTVHVHAHYRLALGDDMTKNLRLPLEGAYLASAERRGLFDLPAPEFEYVVFVLRMVVKHSTWDAQLDRKGRLTPSERRELADLRTRSDPEAVQDVLRMHLSLLPPDLFRRCESAVAERISRAERAVVAGRLLRCLDAFKQRPEWRDLPLRMWRRRWRKVEQLLPGCWDRKRLDTGGILAAIVGSDGAGKSSAVQMVADLTSRHLVTQRVHLGKPPQRVLTRVVKRPLQRLRGNDPSHATRIAAWADWEQIGFPGYTFMLWHLLTARDRYHTYRRARRAANAGAVVICDRYPVRGLHLMDSARTGQVPGLERRRLARAMADREAWYYAQILPPDLLVVLRVEPQLAVGRTRDDREFVLRRAREVANLRIRVGAAVDVDANQPLDDMLADVRRVVWGAL